MTRADDAACRHLGERDHLMTPTLFNVSEYLSAAAASLFTASAGLLATEVGGLLGAMAMAILAGILVGCGGLGLIEGLLFSRIHKFKGWKAYVVIPLLMAAGNCVAFLGGLFAFGWVESMALFHVLFLLVFNLIKLGFFLLARLVMDQEQRKVRSFLSGFLMVQALPNWVLVVWIVYFHLR